MANLPTCLFLLYLFKYGVHAVIVEHGVLLGHGDDVVELGHAVHDVARHVHHAAALCALSHAPGHDVRLCDQRAE